MAEALTEGALAVVLKRHVCYGCGVEVSCASRSCVVVDCDGDGDHRHEVAA